MSMTYKTPEEDSERLLASAMCMHFGYEPPVGCLARDYDPSRMVDGDAYHAERYIELIGNPNVRDEDILDYAEGLCLYHYGDANPYLDTCPSLLREIKEKLKDNGEIVVFNRIYIVMGNVLLPPRVKFLPGFTDKVPSKEDLISLFEDLNQLTRFTSELEEGDESMTQDHWICHNALVLWASARGITVNGDLGTYTIADDAWLINQLKTLSFACPTVHYLGLLMSITSRAVLSSIVDTSGVGDPWVGCSFYHGKNDWAAWIDFNKRQGLSTVPLEAVLSSFIRLTKLRVELGLELFAPF